MATPTSYSSTPLAKKLGIVAGSKVVLRHAPDDYDELAMPLPPGVLMSGWVTPSTDLVHVFVAQKAVLQRELTALRKGIRPDAVVWISWPKRAGKGPMDVTEDTIRDVGLPLGFVDLKVCSVSAVWSGLQLMIRKNLR
jgi:hypothetical protein